MKIAKKTEGIREKEVPGGMRACFGNALSIEGEFDLRSQILVYPSLPQLARVGPDAFDVACRSTERTEVVPPG